LSIELKPESLFAMPDAHVRSPSSFCTLAIHVDAPASLERNREKKTEREREELASSNDLCLLLL